MALIYCVEDDDGIRELISCALKSGGYEVKAFPKAKPFYEEIRNKEPSLVLLDIMLPDEDGYSILSKLKKDSHTQDVPDRKSTRLNSSHRSQSRMPSSA